MGILRTLILLLISLSLTAQIVSETYPKQGLLQNITRYDSLNGYSDFGNRTVDLVNSTCIDLNGTDNFYYCTDYEGSQYVVGGTQIDLRAKFIIDDLSTNYHGVFSCGGTSAAVKGFNIYANKTTGIYRVQYSNGTSSGGYFVAMAAEEGVLQDLTFSWDGIVGHDATLTVNGVSDTRAATKGWTGNSTARLVFGCYSITTPITFLNGRVLQFGYAVNGKKNKLFNFTLNSGYFGRDFSTGERTGVLNGTITTANLSTQNIWHINLHEGFAYSYPFSIMGDYDYNILYVSEDGVNTTISRNTTTPITGTGSLNIAITGAEADDKTPSLGFSYLTDYVGYISALSSGITILSKYKLSFNYRVNSGTFRLSNIIAGADTFTIDSTLVGTRFEYVFQSTENNPDSIVLEIDGLNYNCDVDIDDVLIEPLAMNTYNYNLNRNVINLPYQARATTENHAALISNQYSVYIEFIQYNYAINYGATFGARDNELLRLENSNDSAIWYCKIESAQAVKQDAVYGIGIRDVSNNSMSIHSKYHPPLYSVRKMFLTIDNSTLGATNSRLYDYGVVLGSNNAVGDLKGGTSGHLILGDFGTNDEALDHNIDILDVKIWDKVITYDSVDINTDDLIVSYAMDESSGNIIDSKNGYNFTTLSGIVYKSIDKDIGVNGCFITNSAVKKGSTTIGHNGSETQIKQVVDYKLIDYDTNNFWYTAGVPNEISFDDLYNHTNDYIVINKESETSIKQIMLYITQPNTDKTNLIEEYFNGNLTKYWVK